MPLSIARIYDERGRTRAYRVLVDRLWPRGITKDDAALDEWCKDAAPSTELRRWYGHEPERFKEFARRYRAELRRRPTSAAVAHLRDIVDRRANVTLLTATKEVEHSGAQVLFDHLTSARRR
jgi:uncharacterized protein YeaO (DUF488 family)